MIRFENPAPGSLFDRLANAQATSSIAPRRNRQYILIGGMQNSLCHASKQELRDAGTAVGADNDQVRRNFLRRSANGVRSSRLPELDQVPGRKGHRALDERS